MLNAVGIAFLPLLSSIDDIVESYQRLLNDFLAVRRATATATATWLLIRTENAKQLRQHGNSSQSYQTQRDYCLPIQNELLTFSF